MTDSERDVGHNAPDQGGGARRDAGVRRTALSDLVLELRRSVEHPPQLVRRPRLGFIGVEWSRNVRLRDLATGGVADIRSVTDDDPAMARDAASHIRNYAPNVRVLRDADQLMAEPLDGVVIGAPVQRRAALAMAALDRGLSVFSQYPLADSARDTAAIVERARKRDRLIAVDFHFRDVPGVNEMAALIRDGAVGDVFAVDLRWQRLFGSNEPGAPDSMGCLVELGSHLVDLALHLLDEPPVYAVAGRRYASGRLLAPTQRHTPDDHALADLIVGGDTCVRLSCSFRAAMAHEAHVEATFVGTRGTVRLHNVAGMLDAFRVEHWEGSRCRTLGGTRDAQGGRMADAWARQLARDPKFDTAAARIPLVAGIIDRIAGRESA